MDGMFSKPIKRKVNEPQLAAMVDVFSLLIVFLVMGTVFNAASVVVPEGLKLPLSISRDPIDVTHQVIIQDNLIDFLFLKKKVDPSLLFSSPNSPERESMKSELTNFVSQLPKAQAVAETSVPGASVPPLVLNLVADQSVKYKLVFDVVKMCREAGFQSVLFITMGK